MEEVKETMLDVREEQMVSFTGDSIPTLRTAHFLKPTLATSTRSVPKPPTCSLSSLPSTFEPKEWLLKINFSGWQKPKLNWATWVHKLKFKYQSLWKKAGIYEAIMHSTFIVVRDYDFIIGLAEKWCPKTNTFVFPWGEATITLEDMIILGGYSVLGSPVSSCSDYESRELKEIEDKLAEAGRNISRGKVIKPCQSKWMEKFMDSGSEIEHEAFLSLWLARYVFRDSDIALKDHFFPIAIQMARGERIALAPAVLASIYRDLSLLKETIVFTTKLETFEDGVLALTIWSPFLLVQIWGWERFPMFQPKPLFLKNGDPRCALWDSVKSVKVENARLALDSAGETFRWRPYANPGVRGWHFPEFYREKGEWLDLGSNEDLLSFSLCLTVSKMDGLGCSELYLPHRVAMQFGMDQDVPALVARSNECCKCASKNYIRSFSNSKFYFPPRLFESDVTIRYLNWWRGSVQEVTKDVTEGVVRRKRSFRKRSNRVPWVSIKNEGNDLNVPPGFPPKSGRVKEGDAAENEKTTLEDILRDSSLHNSLDRREGTSVYTYGLAHSPSIVKTGGAGFRKIESLTEPEGKTTQVKAGKDGLQRALEDADVCIVETSANNMASTNKDAEESNGSVFQIPVNELDARVARLEIVMAKLKAARSCLSKTPQKNLLP